MNNGIPNWARATGNYTNFGGALKAARNARNARNVAQHAANRAESALRKATAAAEIVLSHMEESEHESPAKNKFTPFTGVPRVLGNRGNRAQFVHNMLEVRQRRGNGEGLSNNKARERAVRIFTELRQAEKKAMEAIEKAAADRENFKKKANRAAAQARREANAAQLKAIANKAAANKAAENKAAANKAAKANAAAKKAALLQKEAEAWAAAIYAREKLAYNKAVRAGARRRAAAANKAARLGAALQAQRRMNKGANERRRARLANEAREWSEMAVMLANWGGARGVAELRAQRAARPLFGPNNMRQRPKRN
jgi:hypothetical protein